MIHKTIEQLKSKVASTARLSETEKDEIASVIELLSKEVHDLRKTYPEDAQSIADFANVSTGESLKKEKNRDLHELSLKGLEASIKKFEISHPGLTSAVNTFCQKLADLGI